jgi:DNA-binding NtrC family response regulator
MCDGDRIEVEHVAQALNSGRRSTWQVPTPYAPATSTQVGRGAPVVSAASLRELELSALRERVATHTGSRAELAAALGISERSLYRKLKTLGV